MGKPKKKKRKLSAYNKHMSREMKKGRTFKQAVASWKPGSKKSSPKKKTSKKTGGKTNMGKKQGFNTRKLFRLLRIASLLAPGGIVAMGPGTPIQKGQVILSKYTGIWSDGSFHLETIREGYEPFFWTSLATYGIPKVVNFVKGLLG